MCKCFYRDKFPKKQTISKYTTTAWEEENLDKLDDPDVFEFSLAQVSLALLYYSKFENYSHEMLVVSTFLYRAH